MAKDLQFIFFKTSQIIQNSSNVYFLRQKHILMEWSHPKINGHYISVLSCIEFAVFSIFQLRHIIVIPACHKNAHLLNVINWVKSMTIETTAKC